MSVTVTNASVIRISVSVFGFEKIGEFYENLGPYHSQVGVPFEAL